MSKTIIVSGFGPGISSAVAERFGSEGFTVALVARNAERLQQGVQALEAKNIKAHAFPTDLSQPEQVKALVGKVKSALGGIDAIHWNAYGGGAGDVLTASVDELRAVFDIPIASLVTAIQSALPDLRARKGSILITNGGLGFFDPNIDQTAVEWNAMGLSMANSAKHKLAGMLSKKLAGEVFVGEVVVTGFVKGTAFDSGNATIDPKDVAAKFWQLHNERKEASATL